MRTAVRALTCLAAAAGILLGSAPGAVAAVPGPVNAPEYWFADWHLPRLWAEGARGQGVTIAEIDTGVNATLPGLRGKVLRGKDFGAGGNGQIDRDTDPFGHGTAMASIMVARRSTLGITGVAPRAKILPIAVPLSGTSDAAPDDRVDDAIRYAADRGAKIITMALGGTRNAQSDREPCPSDEQAAIYYAMSKGAILLAAAGNRADSDNAIEQPGVCLGVIAVGAVNSSGKVASFSTRHRYVTLAAPGVGIASLGRVRGMAYTGNGTSQATAIASAVAALVWSKHPKLTGSQVVARLLATLNRGTNRPSPAYGYGLLNAYRAVTAKVPADAANPLYSRAAPFAARERAFAEASPPEPKPAATRASPPGTFAAGTAPGTNLTQVVIGVLVGVAGLVTMLALIAGAWRRRRRPPPSVAPRRTPPPVVDAQGVEWHEILGPEPPPQPE